MRDEFPAQHLILEEGQVCRYFYFLESGLLRFYYNVDGQDVTKTFVLPPYCFTSKISFRNQSPSIEGIQSLQQTVCWKIRYSQYRQLEKIAVWNLFMRKLLNEIEEFTEQLMLESKTRTATDRYRSLLENYPAGLLQEIPQKHLASFLGIAPQSLSRIPLSLHKQRKS
jgi:CRP-like cAMP-binding protein